MGIGERRRREREARRNLILDTARRLFFRDGFQAVTVERIAREAELAKGSLYLHFRGKEEIYVEILLADIEAFHRRIASLDAAGGTAAARLLQVAGLYRDVFLRSPELFRIMMSFQLYPERTALPEDLVRRLRQSMKKNVAVIERIFAQGIDCGEFASRHGPFLCRKAFWGLLNGILSHDLYAAAEEKREERIRATLEAGLDVFMRGMKPGSADGGAAGAAG